MNKRPVHLTSQPSQRGFTLFEVLVVITIISIVAMMAAPNINYALERQRNKETAQSLVYALKEARTESFLRKQNVDVQLAGNEVNVMLVTQQVQNGSTPGASPTTTPVTTKLSSYPIHEKAPVTPDTVVTFFPNKRISSPSSSGVVRYTTYCDGKKQKVGRVVIVDANGNVSVNAENSLC